ncbi:TonB-dependent receptor [Sphingobacterium bambusae]|uniref:Outer membrane beta-barrel protein n=1 Tax=Sphingobacterium bambusae TaxID=662858 RepID=A0ABW6BGS2_9SPHI|nr:outer membrane beta-barrel protein [Sphingobacterium bambusae]WPL47628.1 TonB-dependent receptor [Sphingobacterium bambusae]
MKPKVLVFIFFTWLTNFCLAQTGVLKGRVTDLTGGKVVEGVTVAIANTTITTLTDNEGFFTWNALEPGVYSIILSYVGYQKLTVRDVLIQADQVVTLELGLSREGKELDEVVVEAKQLANTQTAVIAEVKKAHQVVSGISQQQIKISQDRDAGQVMSRIPGLTIVDNRFVVVRGLPERYNQVMFNNVIAPSSEVDRRTFSFDLIPSNVLDRIMINKSGAPENPGDFSGGLIKVYTSAPTNENFTIFSLGANYRVGTSFKPYVYNRMSGTDMFGFDNSDRPLPSSFPSTLTLRNSSLNDPIRVSAPRLLNNDLSTRQVTAMPDINFGASMVRVWNFKGQRLSLLTALNYAQSFVYYEREFARYLTQDAANPTAALEPRFAYMDQRYEKENRISALANLTYVFNPYHKIELKSLFNQIGENINLVRSGVDFIQFQENARRNYMYQYRSRTIATEQLEGTHRFAEGRSTLNWVLGLNYLNEQQPNLRRFRTMDNAGDANYSMIIPPSSNLVETGTYHGDLREIGINHGVNFTQQVGHWDDDMPILLRAGYMLDYRNRRFGSRYFSYRGASGVNTDTYANLPLNQIFVDDNFGSDGFIIEEGTSPRDSYDARNFLSAGYLGIELPLGDFYLSGGVRAEYNILSLNSALDNGIPVNVDNPIFSPLGFLNIEYSFNDMHKMRGSYGRTVNRPEFREIAPFLFYDFEFDAGRYGNPDLQTANIDNFDLRYEFYPRNGETISLGTFYKRFTNPIETAILLQGGDNPAFTFTNAAGGAYSYGLELELRKSLRGWTSSTFMDKLSINLNASLIKSEVDYGTSEDVVAQDRIRPMQGQSPYVANVILAYQDEEKGWQASAAYNVMGARIYAIGSVQFPAIYELPRNAVDITITKNIKQLSIKAGVQDLLNAPYRFYQDTNRDQRIDREVDDVIFHFRKGPLCTLGLTYTLK